MAKLGILAVYLLLLLKSINSTSAIINREKEMSPTVVVSSPMSPQLSSVDVTSSTSEISHDKESTKFVVSPQVSPQLTPVDVTNSTSEINHQNEMSPSSVSPQMTMSTQWTPNSTSEINNDKKVSPKFAVSPKMTPKMTPVEVKKLRKCCPNGFYLENNEAGVNCVKYSDNLKSFVNLSTFSFNYEANFKGILIKSNNFRIEFNNLQDNLPQNELPKCGSGREPRILHNRNGVWYRIEESSEDVRIGLDYFLWAAWIPIDKSSYCLDMDGVSMEACLQGSNSTLDCQEDPTLVFCDLQESTLNEFTVHRYIYGLSSLVTSIPIVVTLALFLHLDLHRNPRKWVLMSYFVSYAAACFVHGAQILIYINNLDQAPTLPCKLFNHLFVYLVAVFGTACMFVSLDIFFCFWRMNSQLGIINPSKWGIICAIVFTWIGPLVAYIGGEIWREYLAWHPPDLGWKKCISLNFDTIEFLIMIQFVFKFGVYLSTSFLIRHHKKSTQFATPGAQNDFNESTRLYAKLFVTTGMPFTCLALDYCFAEVDPMGVWWFLIRFPHSFIGLYILLVFGLSTEVRRKWASRHGNNDLNALKMSSGSSDSDYVGPTNRKTHIRRRRSDGDGTRGLRRTSTMWSFIGELNRASHTHKHSSKSITAGLT